MSTPFQTSKAEWDAFFAEMQPRLLEWLKSNGTSVDKIETYESTVGVKSLPARYELGGVRKTVLVPLAALTREIGIPEIATTGEIISEWNKTDL